MAQPPAWVPWDSAQYAQAFNGKEITPYEFPKQSGSATTYRNDYPTPPLYWAHTKPPDHSHRPTPAFGYTSSHRVDFIEHKLGNGAAPIRPYPEQKFKPKLSSVTTSRDDFRTPMIPAARPTKNANPWKPTDAPMGTTTMRSDFKEWSMPSKRVPPMIEAPKPSKFHGNTTTRASFPWPSEIPPPKAEQDRAAHIVPAFAGTTTYRDSYPIVELPGGFPADIGIQVSSKPYKKGGEGGQFDMFIKAGAPAPAIASKTFTTTVDNQQTAAVVVIAKRPEYHGQGVIVGHFSLDGIKPEATGVPKIEVTIKLVSEKALMAQAYYKNGKKTKALTFKANKPLRQVATAAEIPDE